MWSGDKLRNTPTSKVSPSNRHSFIACEDASITTCVHPSSAICRKIRWSAIGSGVVFCASAIISRPENAPNVPIIPVLCPFAIRISRSMWVVVVFPFVPVTATMVMRSAGLP